jgi:hypothetical protein
MLKSDSRQSTRIGVKVADDFRGSGKGHRGNNHGMSWSHTHGFERQVQRGCARVDGDGVLLLHVLPKLGFELFRFWAGGEPSFLESINNFVDLGLFNIWPVEWDRPWPQFWSVNERPEFFVEHAAQLWMRGDHTISAIAFCFQEI